MDTLRDLNEIVQGSILREKNKIRLQNEFVEMKNLYPNCLSLEQLYDIKEEWTFVEFSPNMYEIPKNCVMTCIIMISMV